MDTDGAHDPDTGRVAWYQRRLILGPLVILTGLVLDQFTTMDKATEIGLAFWVLFAVVAVLWRYHRETWFWVTTAAVALVHAAAIFLIPVRFPSGPAITYLLPASLVDCLATLVVFELLASRLSAIKDGAERS